MMHASAREVHTAADPRLKSPAYSAEHKIACTYNRSATAPSLRKQNSQDKIMPWLRITWMSIVTTTAYVNFYSSAQKIFQLEKELFRKIQLEKQGEWFLSATKIAPWPPTRLKNHITRLIAITLGFVNMAFKKSRMSNSAMAASFTANITEAHQTMASASKCSAQVYHKLLLDHPCALTPECKLDIVACNKDKFPNLVARIADGEGQDKDTAISQLADQNKIVTAALAQIQLVVNHRITRMIVKLLTPAKCNGLMLLSLVQIITQFSYRR
jgi:hypothetical protein